MYRRVIVPIIFSISILSGLLILVSSPALASSFGGCLRSLFGTAIDCQGAKSAPQSPFMPTTGAPIPLMARPTPAQLITAPPVPLLNPNGKGGMCLTYTTNPSATTPAALAYLNLTIKNLLATYPPCPPAAAPAAPPPAVTPQQLAAQFWDTIPLPAPQPSIPPGYAVTGKLAYLVTDGTLAPNVYQTTTILGPLSVTAHGSYTVHWGDGATSGPYNSEGRPYPNGNISHTYDNVGTVTVTVDESWTATWSLGGAGGTLTRLQTEGTIHNFLIRQIQAVITS